MANKLLIELQYLGNIAYYQYLLQFDEIIIEKHENLVKASYRNRTEIASPNGILTLSIPIKGGRSKKQLYREVEIASEPDWKKIHWESFCTCYRSSPYFEFYEDELREFYEEKYTFLLDFNRRLHEWVCEQLGIDDTLHPHTDFRDTNGFADFRNTVHPKVAWQRDSSFKPSEYFQVFGEKLGFIPNLSILDLLFNEGPNSLQVLEQSIKADAK